jgi:hypothetical protein
MGADAHPKERCFVQLQSSQLFNNQGAIAMSQQQEENKELTRARECFKEVIEVLKKHNCEINFIQQWRNGLPQEGHVTVQPLPEPSRIVVPSTVVVDGKKVN